jgi:hypothetical protein
MNGFPVSINNINMVTGDRNGSFGAGLQFDLTVGLQEGANAISGTTKLSIWGKMSSETGPQDFEFDGIDLDSIGINADLGAVIIKGGLMLYDSHATFGDGFRGAVSATFIDQATIEATAQFGSVNDYRYWYVDGKALFNEGIPMFSGLGVYGFGGGAWYHMQKSGDEVNLDDEPTQADAGTTPGTTNSGYSFEPNKNIDLGLNAKMIIGTHPKPDAFNGDVGLEAQFLSGGGIGTIALVGDGYMLCGINNRSDAKVTATMDMEYNFPTKTFHGVFDVDIIASPLDGGGQTTLHFDPDLWYVKVGEPSNRISLKLDDWLQTDAYFMVGQQLPTPQLPSEILELFPNYTVSRNPQIESGSGFAFGASSGFDTGRKPYLIFYGEVSALVGFDLALLDYGEDTSCEGQTGSIGINGWYASGQIYAAIAASIGMHVDLWFTSGNYEILSLQVGAALQGAGPNPTWVKGVVGGEYRILSGAVKGYCNYHFSMGDECEMVIESPLKPDLISDINPINGEQSVDVHTEPQVAMNFKLNAPFELNEMPEGSGQVSLRTFRVKLSDFSLHKAAGSDSIAGYENLAPDSFSVYYKPNDIMAGQTNYKFSVSAYGEEYIGNNWEMAKKKDGTIIKQKVSSNFKTGPAPDVIAPSNVAYSYPVYGHSYFLQDECRNGRIQLISGYPDMFAMREGYNIEFIARFVPADINMAAVEVPFTYNNASRSIHFDIPSLINNRQYYLQIVKKEVCTDPFLLQMQQVADMMQQGGMQQQLITLHEKKLFEHDSTNVFVSSRKISGQKVNRGEKLLYVVRFKTSKFNTLQAKLSTFNHVSTTSQFGFDNAEIHTATYEGAEFFDDYDFKPKRWVSSGAVHTFGPLVKINGSARTSVWHTSFANPSVYDRINWMRSRNFWGSGSTKYEVYMWDIDHHFVEADHNSYRLTADDMFSFMNGGSGGSGSSGGSSSSGGQAQAGSGFAGAVSNLGATALGGSSGISNIQSAMNQQNVPQIYLSYNHGIVVSSDYKKLKDKATAIRYNPFISKSGTEKNMLNNIINSNYVSMLHGQYPLKYRYNYYGCLGVDESAPTFNKPFVY